eukprot:751841-Lingulodinium_polyedra.AAC.1
MEGGGANRRENSGGQRPNKNKTTFKRGNAPKFLGKGGDIYACMRHCVAAVEGSGVQHFSRTSPRGCQGPSLDT